MTKINIQTKVIILSTALLASCAAPITSVKVAPDATIGEGGHRGTYMTRHDGEKIHIGEWLYWYPNGQKKLRAYYKLGTPHGYWAMWDEAGTLRLEGYYRLGRGVGKWTAYYSTGQKQHEGRFSNDLEVGHWIFWYLNGSKRMEGDFKYGEWHGEWKFYKPNGEVAFTTKYNRGRAVTNNKQ